MIDLIYAALHTAVKDENFARTMDSMNLGPVPMKPAKARIFLEQEIQRYGLLVEKSGLENSKEPS